MEIRHALTGVAAAAVLVMGGSVAAVAESPAPSGPAASHAGVSAHNIHADGSTAAPLAAATTGTKNFVNGLYGDCLDDSSTAGLRMYACSDASYDNGYQKWVIYWENSDGTWVDWKNVATGKCMDYSSGAGLRLYTCSSASYNNGYQMWND